MVKKNPFIEPENYYDGYQESIDKLKDNPEYTEFDKLCHLVFMTPDGKHLMEELEKRYLIPALATPNNPNFETLLVWTDGYKEAFRMLKHCVKSHEQRIKAETNKK